MAHVATNLQAYRATAVMPALVTILSYALGLAASHSALAQDQALDCKDPTSQVAMTMCAGRAFEEQDRKLNAVYARVRRALAALDAELEPRLKGAEKALVAAQRGWIAYRDGHCETVGFEAAGGTMRPMLESSCMAELTEVRTKELEGLLR